MTAGAAVARPMTKAHRLAVLKALSAGLQAVIKDTEAQILELSDETGADHFDTPYGPLSVGGGDARIQVADERGFLEWVKENHPEQIMDAVRPAYTKALLAQLAYDAAADLVILPGGEIAEWAGLSEPRERFVAWPKSTRQTEAKEAAVGFFRDRAEDLTAGLAQLTDGTDR